MTRALILAAALATVPTGASAVVPCGPPADVAAQLASKFGEIPVGMAIQSNDSLFQLFSSKDGDTWTAVTTVPGGMSCIIATGKHLELIEILKGDPV